ncbi:MAG: thiol reductant ABC exporter subunit CydD, partial [Gracilibacteraceae bacterium]|nr:thiol reductant ABC exporter subunit CydD [Gracilibacteraceae bacterium]
MIDKNLWREAGRDKNYLMGTALCGLAGGALILAQAWMLASVVDGVFLRGWSAADARPSFVLLVALVTARALTG